MTLANAHSGEYSFARHLFTDSEPTQVIGTIFEIIRQPQKWGEVILIYRLSNDC